MRSVQLTTVLVVACARFCPAQQPSPAPIPETEITALRQELAQGERGASSVDVRRACKSVIRKAEAILETSPDAPNRFAVLDISINNNPLVHSIYS